MIGHNQKEFNTISSLTTEERTSVLKSLKEIDASMSREYAEKEFQKTAIDNVCDKFNLNKKVFKKISKSLFKMNYEDECKENDAFRNDYENITMLSKDQ